MFAVPLLQALLDLVWPRTCEGCGRPAGAAPGHLCWDCRSGLPIIRPPFCVQCGDPVEGAITQEYRCAFCIEHAPAFAQARSAVRFRGVVPGLLHRFKYGAATHLAPDLAGWLEACVSTEYPGLNFDAIAFVPLYPARERTRTYNQAALLAESLARRLKLPVARGCLKRVRDTGTQTRLSARARAANVRGAFAVTHPGWVDGRRFLLVDDVMTIRANHPLVKKSSKTPMKSGFYAVWRPKRNRKNLERQNRETARRAYSWLRVRGSTGTLARSTTPSLMSPMSQPTTGDIQPITMNAKPRDGQGIR